MRCFQASGLAFLFIPINTIAYVGTKRTESNDVSGLTNLARNIGGSCGTAFMATMLVRRSAAHENSMGRTFTASNSVFMDRVRAMAHAFGGSGVNGKPTASAMHAAQAFLYNQLHAQAAVLAYIDIIRYLTLFCAGMLLLLPFIPRPPSNAAASAGH
jgi:DHA2 family multidrug resistance protein